MKTAVSIPDELFKRADALAKRLGIARSQLYARAIGDFLERHSDATVTEALDAVYPAEQSRLDPTLLRLQQQALDEDW